jgi:hypothetical protein
MPWICHDTSRSLIDYLRTPLTDEVATQIDYVSKCNPLGYNESKRTYGVPFGQAAIIAMANY